MRRSTVAAIVALLCLATAAHPTHAQGVDAPLAVRTQGTFRELFLDVTLSDARAPARPSLEVRWAASNDWSTPTLLSRGGRIAQLWTDEQADSLTLSAVAPWSAWRALPAWLASRGSTAVEWRLTEHWGGWSDPVITLWHRVIHVFNYERGQHGESAIHLRLGESDARRAIWADGARLAPGDLVLRNQLVLARGGVAADLARDRWAVALRADVKAPAGRLADAGGSGGWDAGAALVATAELAPWATLHGLASASAWSHLPASAAVQARRWHLGAEASLALHRGAWALLVEDRVLSAPFEGGWAFVGERRRLRSSAFAAAFRAQNQVSVGVRRGAFTVWVSEDVTPGNGDPSQRGYYLSNAPDITLGVAWVRPL